MSELWTEEAEEATYAALKVVEGGDVEWNGMWREFLPQLYALGFKVVKATQEETDHARLAFPDCKVDDK